MPEANEINGVKVTQIGEDDTTGLNARDHLYIAGEEVFASNSGVNPNEEKVVQTAHGFTVGTAVYDDGSTWQESDAGAESTTDADGIVSVVTDANNFIVQFTGLMVHDSGEAAGTILYVGVGGGETAIKPVLPNFVKPKYKQKAGGVVQIMTEALAVQGAP